jgi:alpha 1,6-mannosyltransferase
MSIPRRILQTHRSPDILRELRQGWIDRRPGYEYRFFDDAGCLSFMREHRSDLLDVYESLPLAVQRADLFRYVAIHVLGGLYTDVDTECLAPLHAYVDLASDALVVCPEMTPDEFPAGAEHYMQFFVPPVQWLQWTFCAPPGHPALARMIERIVFTARRLSPGTLARLSRHMRFTLEFTGPMGFTHVVNEFLEGSRAGRVETLPRATWGLLREEQTDPRLRAQARVLHRFDSSWVPGREHHSAAARAVAPVAPESAARAPIRFSFRL